MIEFALILTLFPIIQLLNIVTFFSITQFSPIEVKCPT